LEGEIGEIWPTPRAVLCEMHAPAPSAPERGFSTCFTKRRSRRLILLSPWPTRQLWRPQVPRHTDTRLPPTPWGGGVEDRRARPWLACRPRLRRSSQASAPPSWPKRTDGRAKSGRPERTAVPSVRGPPTQPQKSRSGSQSLVERINYNRCGLVRATSATQLRNVEPCRPLIAPVVGLLALTESPSPPPTSWSAAADVGIPVATDDLFPTLLLTSSRRLVGLDDSCRFDFPPCWP